ncbi:MAG: vitamin B12 dependent-methionine synthase activation domain-containing protein [candidate division Zixibacteria bacterium]
MKKTFKFPIAEITPSEKTVLKAQGLSDMSRIDDRILRLAENAVSTYKKLVDPVGILADISETDFKEVFLGEGNNESDAPLDSIYKSSESMSLFSVTIGKQICTEISSLFEANDFPSGSMLDSAASEGAELVAEAIDKQYRTFISGSAGFDSSVGFMRFSPGYCGWHISAQKRLFEFLKPGEIGIELNDSYLMIPIKSVSGIIISGKKGIFQFDDLFDFCAECRDHSCRDRIETIMKTNSY